MTRRLSIAWAAAGLWVLPVQAKDPLSYSYWQASYLRSEVQNEAGGVEADDESEGFRGALNIGLSRHIFFTGDYDQRRWANARDGFGSAGLGVHTMDPTFQFVGLVTYERAEHDDNLDSANDATHEGYGVEAGLRLNLPSLVLHAAYRHLDLGTEDTTDVTGAVYGGGLALQLSPWWALVGDYRVRSQEFEDPVGDREDEYNEWSVGFRRYFATNPDRRLRKGGVLGGIFTGGDPDAEE